MEVRDSLHLLLVVGFCVGPVFAVIICVYWGAVVYMVPLWYRSILWEKRVIGVKMYVWCWQCAKCLWVMCNGTYMWVHVIQLPVYAWVSCSSHRGMYGEAVFIMDVGLLTRWSPPSFGLQNFSLRRLVCEDTICMWLWCPILICVYSEAQTVKFLLGIFSHSRHCVTTGGIIIKKALHQLS